MIFVGVVGSFLQYVGLSRRANPHVLLTQRFDMVTEVGVFLAEKQSLVEIWFRCF